MIDPTGLLACLFFALALGLGVPRAEKPAPPPPIPPAWLSTEWLV